MSSSRPSAMELMLYADGELDQSRAAEVEAWLAGSAEGRAVVATFGELGAIVRGHADETAQQAGADRIADEVMARIDEAPVSEGRVVRLQPSQPHASWVGYAMTGLAAAAAVAFVMWRLAGSNVSQLSSTQPTARPSQADPGLVVASAPIPASDPEDREPGVSVDAIEFGAHTGTIFYVPNDTGTTTVVWLTDDDTGDTK
ncbi:MAG: hypothetical protein HY898_01555 [Deltaproteobacteria bacterium]|nr:hypothetical protein [Deltaproteobacteria bacterium]